MYLRQFRINNYCHTEKIKANKKSYKLCIPESGDGPGWHHSTSTVMMNLFEAERQEKEEEKRQGRERSLQQANFYHGWLLNFVPNTSIEESASLVIRGINNGERREVVKKKPNKLSETG